jgi:hypothetical protein
LQKSENENQILKEKIFGMEEMLKKILEKQDKKGGRFSLRRNINWVVVTKKKHLNRGVYYIFIWLKKQEILNHCVEMHMLEVPQEY